MYPCIQWKPHLHTLVLAQAVNDLDDEVLGNLEVLQANALRAVQHEEEVDRPAGALCIKAQEWRGLCLCPEHLDQSSVFGREMYQSKQLMSALSAGQVGAPSTTKALCKIKQQNSCLGDLRVSLLIFPFARCSAALTRHQRFQAMSTLKTPRNDSKAHFLICLLTSSVHSAQEDRGDSGGLAEADSACSPFSWLKDIVCPWTANPTHWDSIHQKKKNKTKPQHISLQISTGFGRRRTELDPQHILN